MTLTQSIGAVQPGLTVPSRLSELKRFRLIPSVEANPRIIKFSQTVLGKVALLALFGVILSRFDDVWPAKLAIVSAMAFVPKARRILVLFGTILATNFFWFEHSFLERIAAAEALHPTHIKLAIWVILPFAAMSVAFMWIAATYRNSLVGRRPLICLLAMYGTLLIAASYVPFHGALRYTLWAFLFVFASYFWYLAYAVSDCATRGGDNIAYQFGSFHAFWGSTSVPLPKGSGYWRRIEAKTEEELAITMIKGVKLMAWCFLLAFVSRGFNMLIYQKLGVPAFQTTLSVFFQGRPFTVATNWSSLVAECLAGLLSFSIWGHTIIATCRMAGFRALRNTYAPLSSQTVAEYWNRYFYYYKELLVEMFFYPAFIRFFKRNPTIRIFFATFAAAWFGNNLFHLMRDVHVVASFGLAKAIIGYPYAFYSVILALGISISQIRSRRLDRTRGWIRTRLWAPACVFTFYCLLHVFESLTMIPGLHYVLYLFSGR
ncbi:MAG TPA: hypothetical protein VKY85_15200 [Candidatus Angelobacter sp.]|nr:hypothetical protein [Candidatus Angelobacter sp.]